MSDLVRIGSTLHSWNSQSFKIDGLPYNGVLSVDYEDKRTRKRVYGAKRDGVALGFTSGKSEPGPFVMKMLADSAQVMLNQLAIKGLGSYGDAEDILISIQVFEPPPSLPGLALAPSLLIIASGCRVAGVKDSSAEGIDEKVSEVSFDTLRVLRNGLQISSLTRAVPL